MSDVDTDAAAAQRRRDEALWALGGYGKCWVCGARTPHRIEGRAGHGRHRCPECEGEGYVTYPDGTPFRTPDIPWDVPGYAPPPEKITPVGQLPDWWAGMPPAKPERERRVDAVADGRRPEIDPMLLGPPDKVRKATQAVRQAGWLVWTALLEGGGTSGRHRVLMVAYRGSETVVLPWDQAADLTWKGGRAQRWIGKAPVGSLTMTAAMKVMMEVRE